MRLRYRDSFLKDLDDLPDNALRQQVIEAIQDLKGAEDITELLAYHPVKKMEGFSAYYRLRIGKYRLGFKLEKEGSLTLLRFLERGIIYEKFP